jgi:predicted nucleic acid-binding protein
MTDYLLDTNILIRYLRKTEGYDTLLSTLADNDWLCISVITRFEILRGLREHERETTFSLLNSLESLIVNSEIADSAGEFVRTSRARGITLSEADSLIAATALQHQLSLVTTNSKHFPMSDLVVYQVDDLGKMALRE